MPPLRPPPPPPRRSGLFLRGSFRSRPAPAARSPLEAAPPPPRASSSSSSVVPVLLRLLRAGGGEGAPLTSSSSSSSRRRPGPPAMEGEGEEARRPLRALRAAAALGLPGEHRLVRALEEEARRRLARLGPEDAALALSDARGRHPTPPTPLLDACLRRLEEARLEEEEEEEEEEEGRRAREGVPVPRLLLLSGSRPHRHRRRLLLGLLVRRLEEETEAPPLPEPERAAVEEALAWCAPLAGEEALGALFRSAAFARHPHPLLVRRLAGCFPGKAEGCSPPTVAALALHLARHRLREPPLLDSIAAFLLPRVEHLDLKVIQRLVFPFSRLSYQPPNHLELFPSLAAVLERRAAAAPLAALNILMSLFQLRYFPATVLHRVFSRAFVADVTSSPCGRIAQNYLSLLDAAVQLELSNYSGPRLEPWCRVSVFHRLLTADGAQCSYKGLVREALQQLVGKEGYQQDTVVPPGYCIDFLLCISSSGRVLPIGGVASAAATVAANPQAALRLAKGGLPSCQQELLTRHRGVGGLPRQERLLPRLPPQERHSSGLAGPGSPAGTKFPQSSGAAPRTQPSLPAQEGMVTDDGPREAEEIHRVVLCVNDNWHYCRDTPVLVGSRAMRNRHLSLLGYRLVQLPYLELEKVQGLEEAKQYLCQKVRELHLPFPVVAPEPSRGKEEGAPGG